MRTHFIAVSARESGEIGERLGIARKTAEFHINEIKRRLEVRDPAGIVRYAIRQGIIEA